MMRKISIYFAILIGFLFASGCGLIPISHLNAKEKQHQQVAESKQKSSNANVTHDKQEKQQQLEKKPIVTAKLFNTIKQEIISVEKEAKQDDSQLTLSTKDINKTNHPSKTTIPDSQPKTPIENTENDPPNSTYPDSNQKYSEAKKKADELKNTDQVVTVDQANLYQEAVETSTVVGQVLKDQKVHITDTQVDKDDYEIWCFVTGNDGSKDFSGWISYNNLK